MAGLALRPLPLTLVRTAFNHGSLAAVMSVLETELPPGTATLRLVRSIAEFDGRGLLMCSFMSARAPKVASELTELRRRLGEGALSLAGGSHPSGDPSGTLAMGFRWVMRGEAGPELASLIRAVAEGQPPPGGILVESARQPLDRYPPWPRSGELFCPIEITRGCPLGCGFCQTPALHGRRPRHRSPTELSPYFAQTVATGHTFTRFVAPNSFGYGSRDGLTPDPRELEALFVTARRAGLRIYLGSFPSEVRPESVSPEMLGLVRDHCENRSIVVGIQSGSDEVLRRIGRGHTVEQGIRAVERIAHAGFLPRVDFIFGLPGETDADRARTRDLIRHLTAAHGARINTHLFAPLPGTPLEHAEPSPVDSATRELLEEITGRGQANALRCFKSCALQRRPS